MPESQPTTHSRQTTNPPERRPRTSPHRPSLVGPWPGHRRAHRRQPPPILGRPPAQRRSGRRRATTPVDQRPDHRLVGQIAPAQYRETGREVAQPLKRLQPHHPQRPSGSPHPLRPLLAVSRSSPLYGKFDLDMTTHLDLSGATPNAAEGLPLPVAESALSTCSVVRVVGSRMGMVGADRSALGAVCCVSGGRGQSGDLVPRGESDGHLPAVLLSGEPVTTWPKVR